MSAWNVAQQTERTFSGLWAILALILLVAAVLFLLARKARAENARWYSDDRASITGTVLRSVDDRASHASRTEGTLPEGDRPSTSAAESSTSALNGPELQSSKLQPKTRAATSTEPAASLRSAPQRLGQPSEIQGAGPDKGPATSAPTAARGIAGAVETRTAKGIFISYRRQDEPNFAGRLYDRLAERFGDDRVFIDIDSIDLGLDFTDVIDQSLARCKVMLVVIGRGWLGATDADGEPRLENPDDFVRLEIEKAMSRRDVRVIPIVVEGAVVPRSANLPSTLAPLARRNGIEMSHARFAGDTERLIKTIERVIGETGNGA